MSQSILFSKKELKKDAERYDKNNSNIRRTGSNDWINATITAPVSSSCVTSLVHNTNRKDDAAALSILEGTNDSNASNHEPTKSHTGDKHQKEQAMTMKGFHPLWLVHVDQQDLAACKSNNKELGSGTVATCGTESVPFFSDTSQELSDPDRASPTSTIASRPLSPSPRAMVDDNDKDVWILAAGSSEEGEESRETMDPKEETRDPLDLIRELKEALAMAQSQATHWQETAEASQQQRSKTLQNLRKKKAEWQAAVLETSQLQEELQAARRDNKELHNQNVLLKAAVSKVAATKDTVKMKLRTKEELYKEANRENAALRAQLQQIDNFHALERELLDHYRHLSRHTGYHKWGKPIRLLEAQIEERGGDATDLQTSNSS